MTGRFIDTTHGNGHARERWERLRCALLALGAGLTLALVTAGYAALAGAPVAGTSLGYFVPFLFAAAIAGVTPPSYVAFDMFRRHQWLSGTSAAAIALMVAFVVFWTAAVAVSPRPQQVRMDPGTVVTARHYDRGDWMRYPSLRDRMADDLITSGLLRGMTVVQVRTELGTPTKIVGPGTREMIYQLGERAGMKPVLLSVGFGANGRVADVTVQE